MQTPPIGQNVLRYVPLMAPSELNYPLHYQDQAGLIVSELARQPLLPATRDLGALQVVNRAWHALINPSTIYQQLAPLLSGIRRLWGDSRMVVPYLSPLQRERVQEGYQDDFDFNGTITAQALAERAENPDLTPEDRADIFDQADGLEDNHKAKVLAVLAKHPALTVDERSAFFMQANGMDNEYFKAVILAGLSQNPGLTADERTDILDQASSMTEPFGDTRTIVLSRLAKRSDLTEDQRATIFEQAGWGDDANKATIFAALGHNPLLTGEERAEIFHKAVNMNRILDRAIILAGLARNPGLSPEERSDIFNHAERMRGGDAQMIVLSRLAKNPGLTVEERKGIFALAKRMPRAGNQAAVLAGLAKNPGLTGRERARIVKQARTLPPAEQAKVLVSVANRYPWVG